MHPAWLLLGAGVCIVGLVGTLALALDAGWDRPIGRTTLVLLLGAALLPLPGRQEAHAEAVIARCAVQVVQGLRQGGGSEVVRGCGSSPFRDRWLRRRPFRLVETTADGPLQVLPADAAPGTFLVARKGPAGWASAVTLERGQPAFFSIDGRPWIGAFTGGER